MPTPHTALPCDHAARRLSEHQPALQPEAPRHARAALLLAGMLGLLLVLLGLGAPGTARAQGTLTHVFTGGPMALPPGTSQVTGGFGPADPYPSILTVRGIPDDHVVVDFEVVLVRLTHRFVEDLDFLLVAPNGASSILLSDVPGLFIVDRTIRLRDDGVPISDLEVIEDAYAPTDRTDIFFPDQFPAPAPASGWGTALAPLTVGTVNGDWRLFVVDDRPGSAGSMGNWALVFKTQSIFVDPIFPPTPGPTPPIPEPGTWLLLSLGLAGLALRRRSEQGGRSATSG